MSPATSSLSSTTGKCIRISGQRTGRRVIAEGAVGSRLIRTCRSMGLRSQAGPGAAAVAWRGRSMSAPVLPWVADRSV
jgi:hypothetical protein